MTVVAEARILQETEGTRSVTTPSSHLRSLSSQKKASFSLPPSSGQHLVEHLEKNLSQLESKIQFFRFAIKEIEDVTR